MCFFIPVLFFFPAFSVCYTKECVLLFDPQTNTFRLEQLRSAITVKQIRTKGGPSRDLPPSQLPIIAQASRSGSKASKTTRKVQEGSRLPIEATALQPPTEDAPEPEPGPCIIAPVLRLEPEPPAKIPCTVGATCGELCLWCAYKFCLSLQEENWGTLYLLFFKICFFVVKA